MSTPAFDEFRADGSIHIERMDDGSIHVSIIDRDGTEHGLALEATKITVTHEIQTALPSVSGRQSEALE